MSRIHVGKPLKINTHSYEAEMLMRFLGSLGERAVGYPAKTILKEIRPPLKIHVIEAEQILTEIAIRSDVLSFWGNQWEKYIFSLKKVGTEFEIWFREWFGRHF